MSHVFVSGMWLYGVSCDMWVWYGCMVCHDLCEWNVNALSCGVWMCNVPLFTRVDCGCIVSYDCEVWIHVVPSFMWVECSCMVSQVLCELNMNVVSHFLCDWIVGSLCLKYYVSEIWMYCLLLLCEWHIHAWCAMFYVSWNFTKGYESVLLHSGQAHRCSATSSRCQIY